MEVVSDPALAKRIMLRMISVGERDFAESSLERRWWITSLFGVDLFARPAFGGGMLVFTVGHLKKKRRRRRRRKKRKKTYVPKSFPSISPHAKSSIWPLQQA